MHQCSWTLTEITVLRTVRTKWKKLFSFKDAELSRTCKSSYLLSRKNLAILFWLTRILHVVDAFNRFYFNCHQLGHSSPFLKLVVLFIDYKKRLSLSPFSYFRFNLLFLEVNATKMRKLREFRLARHFLNSIIPTSCWGSIAVL